MIVEKKIQRKTWFEYRTDTTIKARATQVGGVVTVGKVHFSIKKRDRTF